MNWVEILVVIISINIYLMNNFITVRFVTDILWSLIDNKKTGLPPWIIQYSFAYYSMALTVYYRISCTEEEPEDDDPNDPSKLSLAERVKLFNQKMVTERLTPRATTRTNRFKTQPVTTEEVVTAQKMGKIGLTRTASSILGLMLHESGWFARFLVVVGRMLHCPCFVCFILYQTSIYF